VFHIIFIYMTRLKEMEINFYCHSVWLLHWYSLSLDIMERLNIRWCHQFSKMKH